MERKRSINWYLLGAVIIFLGSLAFLLLTLFQHYAPEKDTTLHRYSISTSMVVGTTVGFDVNTTQVSFGQLTQGSSSTRSLTLSNSYSFPIMASFSLEGSIAPYVRLPPPTSILPDSQVSLDVTAYVPDGTSQGNYTGVIFVTFKEDI